jgi:hypothetical protein
MSQFNVFGDQCVVPAEHAPALSRALPDAQLAFLPGGHRGVRVMGKDEI